MIIKTKLKYIIKMERTQLNWRHEDTSSFSLSSSLQLQNTGFSRSRILNGKENSSAKKSIQIKSNFINFNATFQHVLFSVYGGQIAQLRGLDPNSKVGKS